ncbi:hypothetical protein [Synechococcus sp. RSCCF101]|uniref:hypothetical protein n=1 Tax=Synechococcus sp. RSCCF101 TaxID=2511069 RepID=UPI001CD977CC|nr:hypothetical protein [Synechococcus sp. RSCCF101]
MASPSGPACLLLSGVALMMLTTACRSPEQRAESDEQAVIADVAAVCAARAAVEEAVAGVEGLTPESTVEDAETAGTKLDQAMASLRDANTELEKAEVKEFRDQVELFRQAVAEVRRQKDMTLADASVALQLEAASVLAARAQLDSVVICAEPEASEPAASANEDADDSAPDGASGDNGAAGENGDAGSSE